MITKTNFKEREAFKAIFSISKSIQVLFPLKFIIDLIILNRFKDSISNINIDLFGFTLKSPRIMWFS